MLLPPLMNLFIQITALICGLVEVYSYDESNIPIPVPSNRNRTIHVNDALYGTKRNNTVNTTLVFADFDEEYERIVSRVQEYIFSFNYVEQINRTSAVRIHVVSEGADADYPVLFVVRQERSILSWQVPLFLQNIYDYYTVSRTLCPVQKPFKHQTETESLFVDVSTSSRQNVSFSLKATTLDDFELSTGVPHSFSVSPSEPRYYMYQFPDDLDSVIVKVTSPDDNCTVVSVQSVHCPIHDLDRDVQFTGTYQTMTSSAALTLQKRNYPGGIFYVVFVVKPIDFDCSLKETIVTHPGPGREHRFQKRDAIPINSSEHGNDVYNRRKKITVVVQPTISVDEYYKAVFGSVAFFLCFYLIALFVALVYHCRDKVRGVDDLGREAENEHMLTDYEKMLGSDRAQFTYQTPSNAYTELHSESDQELPTNGPDRVDAPISNELPDSPPYGSTSPTDARFGRESGGIPHRLSPDDDDSSVDEEIDMLHDLDDKDIRRTKTYLYVADLARKDRRVLSKKYKLYSWNLLTIAIFYGLPVIQLVITYQKVLHVTGDLDICYYNFLCAHPLGVLSAFNNVFSNIGYIMLGLLFLGLTWRRNLLQEKAAEMNDRHHQYYGIPQHFGLFYAMGIALTMEGIMSGCYHVCPSYSNFQFDTSFMYMIALLCMLKIYQIRHPDINATANQSYLALAILIFIAVIGVVYDTWYFWVGFFVVDVLATLLISTQIYYMGRWKLDKGLLKRIYLMMKTDLPQCAPPMYPDRMILMVVANLINFAFALLGLLTQPKDFSSFLLAILIVNLLLYTAFYIIMKLRVGERIPLLSCCYILIACVVWAFAMYFFLVRLTSWELSPAESKRGNHVCMLMDFYDAHDVWHCLSAMALFFSFMILLNIDDDLIHTPRDRIPVF